MARKIPQSKSTSRKLGKKLPRFLIIAFCEGKNTEPEYPVHYPQLKIAYH
jgi:hypothetical protein